MDDETINNFEEHMKHRSAERTYNFFRPVGQYIEHVDTVNFSMDKDGTFHFQNVGQVNSTTPQQESQTPLEEEELCHFIHPSVDPQHERQIHDEIKRLVARQGIQEICMYLQQLNEDNKILLPQGAEKAYDELVRMGMPNGEGFSLKTFMKYYKK